ncbi:hypothetical protein [Rufibacter latericius]|uniref:Adhesin domain-containing protein n=1 Tax=Rufibacter latericius TaxID=2487040 RepID=A0A3M9MLI3_9BACT|nr:hypothetical protein [Rufibacter latericius]RNI26055.1 hypothetical protein EFB08_14610 [Rufibacter latericius]
MRLPISKLLSFFCFFIAVGSAQGQTLHLRTSSCKEAVREDIKVEISEHLQQSLASRGVQVSSEALSQLPTCEDLAALGNLSLTLSIPDQPDPIGREQTGADKATIPDLQGAYAHTKVKKVERSFKVDRSDKLDIENQFGRVDVQTWTKNEFAVEVTIVARAITEEKAQEILNKINVRINEDRAGNLISFVTEREPMQIKSSSEKAFEINYMVKMPKSNPLRISNKYGSVQMPDFDGPTDIEVKYGKLMAGSLNNPKNRITVAYSGGDCQISYMKGGDLTAKYSSMRLLGADDINTVTGYSSITIDKVDLLTMASRYDSKFMIGSAGQITGTGSYSGIKIGSLRESASLNVKYCSGFEISNVSSNFKKLELIGGYTGMALSFADNSAFNFEVDTEYGNFKVDQDLANFSLKEVRNTSGSFKGKYGKASPKGTVNVTSRYGSIAFR